MTPFRTVVLDPLPLGSTKTGVRGCSISPAGSSALPR